MRLAGIICLNPRSDKPRLLKFAHGLQASRMIIAKLESQGCRSQDVDLYKATHSKLLCRIAHALNEMRA